MKKTVLLLVVALLVVALIGCGNAKKEEVQEPEVQIQEVEPIVEEEPEIDPALVNRQYQSDISALFQDYLKGLSEEEGHELADYRIEDINVMDDEAKREIVENFSGEYFMTDVLASVTFSVKPAEGADPIYWTAGNGEESGDWVVNKNLLVTMRDGKLTNIGTGW